MLSLTTISYSFKNQANLPKPWNLLSRPCKPFELNIDLTNAIIMKLFDKIMMHLN